MRRILAVLVPCVVVAASVPACAMSRLRERASTALGCSGGILTSSAKDGPMRTGDDGTTYRFCCKDDANHCAEYFCPDSEKAACTRVE